MHQKLHMEEILDLIFDHLDNYPDLRGLKIFGFKPEKTWAALARTCRTFQNPALNALWSVQRSLAPALSCFPDDLWDRTTDSKSFLGFRRPLTLADWERPMLYWTRIRSFRINSLDTVQISPDAIEWLDPDPASFPVVGVFLSPRLSSISLDPTCFATHSSFLSTLSANHPDLTNVDFRGKYRVYRGPGIIQSISASSSLRISNVNAQILERVTGVPYLKTLDITELMSLESFPLGNGVDPRFPCLEELSLWATTPDVGVAMVGAITHRGLKTLNLTFEAEYPTSQTTARLYAAIDANHSYATLDYLRVEDEWTESQSPVDVPDEDAFDYYVVDRGSLQILFAFTNLRTVILKPCYGFHFDVNDRVVSEMARAWCRVEELRFARSHDLHTFGFGTLVTLQGIRAIATHCKNLHTLELNFDATEIPLPPDACFQTSLTTLDVHCSRIVSPTAVASFLSEIFPKLRNVYSFCLLDRPRSAVGRWETVQRLITGSTFRGRSEGSTDEEFTDTDDAYSASESD
ncbi:hypothetical protein DFH06DRAFT_1374261 [Mycena polygramma]|nr:hypothetical protein DFH06DRAFT_1374261 [Mycena polygramma]